MHGPPTSSTVQVNQYFPTGLLKKTYGSRTYPVEYTYDAQGRMSTMKTWQTYNGGNGTPVTTTWNYNPSRGWLDNKRYADNTGPDYSYTLGGRLKTRTWARTGTGGRIVTTYTYGYENDGISDNQHGDVVGIAYSNDPAATPGVTFTYDRRGRQKTVVRNNITTTLSYSDADQLTSEVYSGTGTLNNHSVTSSVDAYLRKYQVTAQYNGSTLGSVETYAYDNASRLETVSDSSYSATYGYVANSPLINQITFKQSATTRMITSKSYDKINRLSSISSVGGASGSFVISSHGYLYNPANQRSTATMKDGAYWTYGYDSLGQVTSGKKRFSDGTWVPGEQFEYVEDDIGNRTSTKVGGDSTGAAGALRSATYTPNNLNQYSSRTVPSVLDIIGVAKNDASVTVNTLAAYRKGEFYQKGITVANNANNLVTVQATSGTTTTKSGNIFVPPATENFTPDTDGNLIQDGRWNYTWDAENRLIRLTARVGGVAPSQVDYEYDWRGRRIKKTVTGGVTSKYLYDGWNLVAELDGNNALVRSYVWGTDLSGTTQGAGGVGGLLWVKPAASGAHFVGYDGNGNVTALVDQATISSKMDMQKYIFVRALLPRPAITLILVV